MLTLRRIDHIRYLFLATVGLYLIFISTTIAIRSQGRKSVLHLDLSSAKETHHTSAFSNDNDPVSPAIRLQELRRVELKNGKKAWELKASEARHSFEKGLTQVNNSLMTLYRSDRSKVIVESDGAKLQIENETLNKANLEGDVKIKLDDDLDIKTGLAFYYAGKDLISSPGYVALKGQGFEIEGTGVEVEIDPKIITIGSNVKSIFTARGKTPSVVKEIN